MFCVCFYSTAEHLATSEGVSSNTSKTISKITHYPGVTVIESRLVTHSHPEIYNLPNSAEIVLDLTVCTIYQVVGELFVNEYYSPWDIFIISMMIRFCSVLPVAPKEMTKIENPWSSLT